MPREYFHPESDKPVEGPDDEGLGAQEGDEHEGSPPHLASTCVVGRLTGGDRVRRCEVRRAPIAQRVGMREIVWPL